MAGCLPTVSPAPVTAQVMMIFGFIWIAPYKIGQN
jgi:hypothetical protein